MELVGDENEAAEQRDEGRIDWVPALQSPRVVKELADDTVRVLLQHPHDDEWRGAEPDTIAFLEDLARALRLER